MKKVIHIVCANCGKHDYIYNEKSALENQWVFKNIKVKREVPYYYDKTTDKLELRKDPTYKKKQWYCSTICFYKKNMGC